MGQEPVPTDATPGQAPEAGESGQAPTTNTDTSSEPAKTPAKSFDEGYVKELRKEAAKERTRATEAEKKLAELSERDKTEGEKLADRVAASEKRATEAETRLLRFEVAANRKLTADAAQLLHGTTREEIEASADALAKFVESQKSTSVPSFDGGTRTTPAAKKSPEQEHNELLLRAFGKQT